MLRAVLDNQTNEAFHNGKGNYTAVLQALEGVTAAQAAWKPAPARNSIWQIVDHLTDAKGWLAASIQGVAATRQGWRDVGGDEAAWESARAQLKEAHEHLMAVIAHIPEEALSLPPMPGMNRCSLDLLVSGVSGHDAYHAGQISLLKALYVDLHP